MINRFNRPNIPGIIKYHIDNKEVVSICITGVSGSGKSVLSEKIIDYIKSKWNSEVWYTKCDKIFFQDICSENQTDNEHRIRFDKYIRERIKESNKQNIYHIIDGANYSAMKKHVWNRCDYIINVNTPSYLRILNVITREYEYSKNGIINEIGKIGSIKNLFSEYGEKEVNLIKTAAGQGRQHKVIEDDLLFFTEKSHEIYEKKMKENNEKLKKGMSVKKIKVPAKIINSFENNNENFNLTRDILDLISTEKEKISEDIYVEEIIKKITKIINSDSNGDEYEIIIENIINEIIDIVVKDNIKEERNIITDNDKMELNIFLKEWQKSYEGMKIIFAGLGASSFADGRATNFSDYDIYIIYDGYDDIIQVSELKHITDNKIYEIDIQGHERSMFEKKIEEYDEIPTLNIEGAIANPEQLLIYKDSDYDIYTRKEKNLKKIRNEFSEKISKVIGAKPKPGKSSKARHKFWNPVNEKDYIKGMKCFYVAWKLTLYAIQLAKFNRIVDFEEPIEFWHKLKEIPEEVIHSKEGYDECFKKLLEMGYVEKFAEFRKLAPSK